MVADNEFNAPPPRPAGVYGGERTEPIVRPNKDDNILSDCEWLYAEDLAGKDVTLTVKAIGKEDIEGGGRKSVGYVIHFIETAKKYKPGVTVRRAICAACGTTNRNEIAGRKLVLYPTTCDAFGQKGVPCIRVRRVLDK